MKIACVLITHFPVKTELQRHEDIQGKPVIVVDDSESRRLVVDSTPSARRVRAGMSLSEAMSRSKSSVVIEADYPYYDRCFQELLLALLDVSDRVEKGSLGMAYVRLDGLEAMYAVDCQGRREIGPSASLVKDRTRGMRRHVTVRLDHCQPSSTVIHERQLLWPAKLIVAHQQSPQVPERCKTP